MAKLVTRPELIERIKPSVEEYFGEKVSKEQLKRDVEYLNELIKIVALSLETEEKTNLGMITIENKFVPGKEGTVAGKDYVTEDKEVIKVKANSPLKNILL